MLIRRNKCSQKKNDENAFENVFHPSAAETRIFWDNLEVNIMTPDAMALSVAMPLTDMLRLVFWITT